MDKRLEQSGIDFLAKQIGRPIVQELMKVAEQSSDLIACDCCSRFSDEWLVPGRYIECSPYPNSPEQHCLSCHMLFQSAPKHLGPGRNGKLGMLKGVGCLISPSVKVVYATGKNHERFASVERPIFDEIVELAGMSLLGDAFRRIPANEPFLLITNLGVKKSSLVKNLAVSHSVNEVVICSESEQYRMAKNELVLPEHLNGVPRGDVFNGKDGCFDIVIASTRGYLDREQAEAVEAYTKQYPMLRDALMRLPRDPHTREYSLRITRRLMEAEK